MGIEPKTLQFGSDALPVHQYSRELLCLAQGHSKAIQVGIEPKTLQFGSDALPVHQAPLKTSVRISISTNVNAMHHEALNFNQRTNGPVNAHLKPEICTNQLV